jgi:hypothetical protein
MSENTATTPPATLPQKPKKTIIGNLWKKMGVSVATQQKYNFLSGSINLDGQRIYITVNKSKLTKEEREAKPTSSDYYICLDDYKPKAKVEAEKVETEEPF